MSTSSDSGARSSLREEVELFTQQHGWALATKSYCPYCKKALSVLNEKSHDYEDWALDQLDDGREIQNIMYDMTNQRTVPYIFHNGNFVGGSTDLEPYFKKLINTEL